ncbi:MAG: hypothetical protein CMF50_05060 [Legionellales bacterium]|nr:hypothetical protein [Legionellales bacterium]|tara:strand:+ start:61977 stop:62243 length:267 start_codon:yes stop_codon:yes gene_type:complete
MEISKIIGILCLVSLLCGCANLGENDYNQAVSNAIKDDTRGAGEYMYPRLYGRGEHNEAFCRRGFYHHGYCQGDYNPVYYHVGYHTQN